MWNKLLHILSSDSQSQTGSDSNILINIRMKTPIWPNDTLKVRKRAGETLAYPPKTEPKQKKRQRNRFCDQNSKYFIIIY